MDKPLTREVEWPKTLAVMDCAGVGRRFGKDDAVSSEVGLGPPFIVEQTAVRVCCSGDDGTSRMVSSSKKTRGNFGEVGVDDLPHQLNLLNGVFRLLEEEKLKNSILLQDLEHQLSERPVERESLLRELRSIDEDILPNRERLEEIQRMLKCLAEQNKCKAQQIVELKAEVESQSRDIDHLRQEIVRATNDRTSFAARSQLVDEENKKLSMRVSEAQRLLFRLQNDYDRVLRERADFKSLFIRTRIRSSEMLSHYIAETNRLLEDKKNVIRLARREIGKRSHTLSQTLADTEDLATVTAEKNTLIDQVEFLQVKADAQDAYICDLEHSLTQMQRLLESTRSRLPRNISNQLCDVLLPSPPTFSTTATSLHSPWSNAWLATRAKGRRRSATARYQERCDAVSTAACEGSSEEDCEGSPAGSGDENSAVRQRSVGEDSAECGQRGGDVDPRVACGAVNVAMSGAQLIPGGGDLVESPPCFWTPEHSASQSSDSESSSTDES